LDVNLQFVGDFGLATSNTTAQERLEPPACPDQGLDYHGLGRRQFPVDPDGVAYEPWRFDSTGNVLGVSGAIAFNTRDQMMHCDAIRCSRAVPTGTTGTHRFFQPTRGFGIAPAQPAASNTFYSDARGTQLVAQDTVNAVQQYVAPGVSVSWNYPGDDSLVDSRDPWGGVCELMNIHHRAGLALALEGAIASPN
jgi:hypothetical protein